MRICFLIHELSRSGGMAMVRRYAAALAARDGVEVDFVLTEAKSRSAPADFGGLPLRRIQELGDRSYDAAVATWWTTAAELWEVDARRRIVFLQNLEQRFYRGDDAYIESMGAAGVLALPVDFVVVASFMQRLLAELRPDARCALVPYGIAKEPFSPRPRPERGERLRVLVEGQPSLWFKGVADGIAAARRMAEPVDVTVVALDPAYGRELGADRVVGALDAGGMADLYARTDVLVKLARFEGFGLAPLEAFHVGLPCVVSPYTGHEEYVAHGENGLVVGFDDEEGAARALDSLARDRDLLARLSEGALRTAASWPSDRDAAAGFVTAIERLVAEEPPPAELSMRALQRWARMWAVQGRERDRLHEGTLNFTRITLDEHRDSLERIRNKPAYRAYTALRKVVRRG